LRCGLATLQQVYLVAALFCSTWGIRRHSLVQLPTYTPSYGSSPEDVFTVDTEVFW